MECRPHLEPHSTEALCICTAELPVCLHEERPGCDALAVMAVPSLAFEGGGQACCWGRAEMGEKGARRAEEAGRLRRGGGGHGDASQGL